MTGKASKRESRLQRQLDKLAKRHDKSVRLSESIQIKDKYIRSSVIPDLSKTPRSQSSENYRQYYFCWDDAHCDTDGYWTWGEPRQWEEIEYSDTIKPHMDSHINNSWGHVEALTYSGKKKRRKVLNKYQPVDSLCFEAQERWLSLESLSQFDELFRMRLGDDNRIWGIRIDHCFFLVWYERYHKICPPDKD